MHNILMVDDDEISLEIARECLGSMYRVLTASSGEDAMKVIKETLPELILLDINMPGMNGFEMIICLKSQIAFRNIPVIFLTASEGEQEAKGLSLGAVDFIKKPFSVPVLQKRVETHIKLIEQKIQLENYTMLLVENNRALEDKVFKKTLSLMNLERAVLSLIGDMIEGKDGYTGGHVVRTAKYMRLFMMELYRSNLLGDIKREDLEMIALYSKLHDVGKIAVAEKTLQKKGVLSVSETLQMRLHTVFGATYIEKSMRMTEENIYLRYAMQMARSHHEWWDGCGYPDNLSAEKIPLLARITSICNEYDVLNHKNGRSHEEAMRIIENSSGTQFDPALATVFTTLPLN